MSQPLHYYNRLNGFHLAVLLVSIPHVLHVPIWVLLVFCALLAWRYFHEHYGWPLGSRLIPLGLAMLMIAALYKHFGYILGRDPGAALLYILLGLKVIEMRSVRDANVAILMLFILTTVALLFSQSITMGVYVFVTVVAICAALVQLNNYRGLNLKSCWWLSCKLALQAIPLMLLIYFLFPRVHGSLWGLPEDAHRGKTGLSEIMRPGSVTELSQSDEIAFRAEFKGPRPENKQLYWRGFVFWETDGRLWSRGPDRPGSTRFWRHGEATTYSITLEANNKPWLFALDMPARIPKDTKLLEGYVLQNPRPIKDRHRYTVSSYLQYQTIGLNPVMRLRALQLPPNVSSRVRALARQWRQQSDGNSLWIAQRALQRFRKQNYVYTLKPPLMRDDPVDSFLFEYKRGFCEHYAAAFVTLMRAADVPSRVVIGYQGGEYNTAGNYFIVRQANAHAWAEVWSRNRGWVRVDPTAAVAPERIELGIEAIRRLEEAGQTAGRVSSETLRQLMANDWLQRGWLRTRLLWDQANLNWYNWTSDYNFKRQSEFLKSLGMGIPNRLGLLLGSIGVFVLFVLLVAWWLLRLKQHRDPTQRYYLLWCQKMARSGTARLPHEGALTYGLRLGQRYPALQTALSQLITLYIRLRYRPMWSNSDAEQFIAVVKAFPVPSK